MLNRREFCKIAGLAAVGTTAAVGYSSSVKAAKSKKPNLLFVFSDQQSRDMVGCYGNKDIITPNLDNFAKEGIKFEHCVSSFPVCSPYRAMLMSGQHPLRNGVIQNDIPLLANNGRYIGHVLRDAGYRMGYVGKWHLLGGKRDRGIPAGPMRYGFDGQFQSNNCHVNFAPGKCFYWTEDGKKDYFDEWEVYGQTRQAMSFLDTCETDEPFALFVSWHPPHDWGWQNKSLVRRYGTIRELMDLYDPDQIKLRPTAEDNKLVRNAYHGYYSMCSGVDKAFGWLMKKLKQKGLDDNTIVVFTADHGDNLSSYGFTKPKNHPEDTAVRVPFIIRWPKRLAQGKTSDMLLGAMDIMPTLLGLMDHEIPESVQGKDLSAAIQNSDDDAVDSVPLFYYDRFGNFHGVYTKQYTYAEGVAPQFVQKKGKYVQQGIDANVLYDRVKDPSQTNNLFGKKEYAAVQKKLAKMTNDWMKHFDDPGVNFNRLVRDYKNTKTNQRPEVVGEAGFPGRPIDLLKG